MSSCGGSISTQTLLVGVSVPSRLVGTDETRQTVAVKAAAGNAGTVWLTSSPSGRAGDGWPLAAGEGYVFGGQGGGAFDGRGARAAVYAIGDVAGLSVHVLTEGA